MELQPGEGAATMRVLAAFPGTKIEPVSAALPQLWTWNREGLAACRVCGGSTIQLNPEGQPDHRTHHGLS